ncbi:hypothetical protein [Paenibacillus xylanilyticus]|uniref:Copper amine oxidase-like N-terminal domain-containing protein n=1 Tax=Paenibacillus xylanilyticus TaxID=248903 RepID=A0A7Y6EUK6_9BACL|nr:hypothetical protein [Paenibacillus xylanilyticus]NUU75746.1 hypothetical protein [Paenibacillus xylanilyticus]
MKKVIILTFVLSLLSVPAAFAVKSAPQKISIFVNNKEIKPKTDVEPTIIQNRLYVPVSIFRDANFTVEYKNSILTMVNKNLLYSSNLELLNAFHSTFINNFEKIDQELVDILGNLLLKEEVDTSKLAELIKVAESDSKSFDSANFTPIRDYSSSFSFLTANQSVNAYKEAFIALEKFIEDGKESHLEEFYSQRESALRYYEDFKIQFDEVFKLSYIRSIS